jgi:hypothetical protein
LPQVRPNRKPASGAAQFGKLLSARAAKLRGSKRTAGTQGPAGTLRADARRLGRTLWAGAQRLGLAKAGAALAAVVVLGLVIWWLTGLGAAQQQPAAGTSPAAAASSSGTPALRGALPLEGVSPMDFRLGDCFKDFDPNSPTSTVVACDTGHSAQLVAIESYAASDAYPGRDPLKQKALDACKAALLTDKSTDYMLSYKLAYPSSSSWGTGDRRVETSSWNHCCRSADRDDAALRILDHGAPKSRSIRRRHQNTTAQGNSTLSSGVGVADCEVDAPMRRNLDAVGGRHDGHDPVREEPQ